MYHSYQKPLSGNRIGVVFGTFAPLHQGHLDLIMRAKKECDGGCMVIVDGRENDRGGTLLPLKKRYRYVREFFADDELVSVYPVDETDLGITAYPNGWDGFIKEVKHLFKNGACGTPVFYVSEPEYAEHLSALGYEVVQLDRTANPISATMIRQNPVKYENDPRAKFIRIPAMDENDESNFDYAYGVGFSTDFFRKQRAIMDDISWKALYENSPVERSGLLYNGKELRRYFELPDKEPDAVIAVCDTKDKGTDYCAMPIAYQYGDNYYIEDFVCDNSAPELVETRLVSKLMKHKVHAARFESNSAGGCIAADVQKHIKEKGGRTRVTTKYSTQNKETRIIVGSVYAKEHFLFKDESIYKDDKEYRLAMNMLCSYTMAGKNKNDDVPDSLSMLADFSESFRQQVTVFQRPF